MKYILGGLGLVLLIGGGYWFLSDRDSDQEKTIPGNIDLVEGYDKMHVGEDGINGYILQLNIFGRVDGEHIRESVRIRNYMDRQFEITFIEDIEPEIDEEELYDEEINEENFEDRDMPFERETIYYILDGKVYAEDEEGFYRETDELTTYTDSSIYLEGLRNITKDDEGVVDQMGQHTYYLYEVEVSKEAVSEMLANTSLAGYEIQETPRASIHLTDEGYVERIVYKFDNLTIQAFYLAVNNSFEMNVPIYEDEYLED